MTSRVLVVFLLFFSGCFSQVDVKSIHKTKEISITIYGDTTDRAIFIGCFNVQKYVCLGNVVKVNTDMVKTEKGDSLVELNFTIDNRSSLNDTNQFVLHEREVLKIRLIREKGIRIPKKKKLVVYLTINGEKVSVVSKRYKNRFCHYGKWDSIYYQKIE